MTQIQNERFDVVELLRRWFVLLLLAGFVGGALGYLVADSRPPSYSTTIDLLVGPVVPNSDVLEGTSDLARTYGEILESRQIIGSIARQFGLAPADVSVSATSQPGSSKLILTVRTPDSEATKGVATALVDALSDVVIEARPATGPADTTVPVVDEQLAPVVDERLGDQIVGNAVVVTINRGELTTTDRSMPLAVGAGAGFVGAMLIVVSIVLTIEQRRRNFEGIVTSHAGPGFDLGRARTSRWNELPLRRGRMSVSSRTSLGIAADSVTEGLNRDARPRTLFVTSSDASIAHLEVVVQLARRLEPAPMIIDPFGHLVAHLAADLVEPDSCCEVVVDDHIVAFCAIPTHLGVHPDAVDMTARSRAEPNATSIVFAALDDDLEVWRRMAAESDRTLVLVKRGEDPTRLSRLWGRIDRLELPVLGTLWSSPRWLTGSRSRVTLRPAPDRTADHGSPVVDRTAAP